MHAVVGEDVAGIRYTRKARFLAGASCAAIACWLPAPASAVTYLVGNETDLRNAVIAANGHADPSATIIVTDNIVMSSSINLNAPTKPITIDTQGFTITGPSGLNALHLLGAIGGSESFTLVGSFVGGDSVALGAAGGIGVRARTGTSTTNNGTIQGGSSQTAGGGVGVELGFAGVPDAFVNNGTIRGGDGPTNGSGGVGAGIRLITSPTNSLVNTGLIEGGAGAVAISLNTAAGDFRLINSGTIRAGVGQADAIRWSSAAPTGLLDLTLEAGSQIIGNVVANPTGLTDVLRLGGTGTATFDVSTIGPSAQYQNFDSFIKTGTGTWTLRGMGTATTGWDVQAGTLLVTGTTFGGAGVRSGATLGGSGRISAGDVIVFSGGTLAPGLDANAPGTLAINGNLDLRPGSLLAYNLGQAGVPGGALNDLVNVNGNVTLDGTLNVTTSVGGTFDPGIYRIINYAGTLGGGGLTVGSVPTPDFVLQTAISGQINLVNTAGLTLNFWDGPGTPGDNAISGSSGTWQAAGDSNWTNRFGAVNAPYAAGSFAIFQGTTGINVVAVDTTAGPVTTSGMQFAGSGYIIQGGDITLTGAQAVIRVGDGTRNGASSNARIDSNLVGSAQLVKSDLGFLTLLGTNTYTGGTLISGGTLVLGNGGTSGSITGDVVNNASLAFSRSDAITFGGAISGSGKLLQLGTGALTLTGANTYNGGTDIASGTLIGSASSFGDGLIANNAALIIDQPVDAAFGNAFIGNGSFIKRGAGNLSLNGGGNFIGPTTVEAGKLSANTNSLRGSAVTVLSGAALGGTGTVGATTIQAGATIAPGNSIGTLNVNGNLTLASGSTYEVEIAGNGASDRIAVSGMATVTGSQIGVTALDPQTSYINGQRYTVITADGGVSGTAPSAVSRSPFLDLSVDQQPNQVDLVIAVKGAPPVTPPDPGTPPVTPPGPGTPPAPPPAVFETVAQTRNQFATAVGLDTLPQAGGTLALYNSILMLDAASARAAFDALSGEVHASAKSALVDESWLLRNAVNDRLRSAFGAVGAAPMATMNYGFSADLAPSASGPMPRLRTDRFAVWGQGYGSWGRTDSDGNAAKLTRSTGGFLLGADAAVFDNLRFGVIAGYSRSEFDVKGRLSSGESDNYHLGLYGGGQWGALGLRAGASYTWHDIETRRTVAFAGFSDNARAGYNAGTAQIFGELGYRVDLGRVALEPFAGLAYVNLHSDGFNETGGAAALSGRGDDTSLGYSTLGLRAATSFDLQGMDLTLRGGLAWRHAFGDVDPKATLAFAGSSSFTVAGLPIAKNAALVEAGLDLAISQRASLGVSYTGQLAEDTQDHAFKGVLAVRF